MREIDAAFILLSLLISSQSAALLISILKTHQAITFAFQFALQARNVYVSIAITRSKSFENENQKSAVGETKAAQPRRTVMQRVT